MVYQFKIKLRGITKPPVWRRVLVPEHFTFNDFHNVIQSAFGWFNYHLYEFGVKPYDRNLYIAIPSEEDFEPPTHDSRKTRLNEMFCGGRKKMVYVYDFGDDWIHEIELEQTLDEHRLYASCIDGKGACPDEDSGGRYGYEMMKENGEIEDIEDFDLEEANFMVESVKSGETNPPCGDDFDEEEEDEEEGFGFLDEEYDDYEEVKKPAKRKSRKSTRIVNKDWMEHMPYKKLSNIDQYYIDLSKRIFEVLASYDEFGEDFHLSNKSIKEMAVNMTIWFMDVVSEGNIWRAFTTECKQRYGTYLPFYDIDENDYYADEVNLEDIEFLLWHYIQKLQEDNYTYTFHPQHFFIELLAGLIYDIFDKEFENAPINDDWRNALQPNDIDEPLGFKFTLYAMALGNRFDYLGYGFREASMDCLSYLMESEYELSEQELDLIMFEDQIDTLYNNRDHSLLGLTIAEWAIRIITLGNKKLAKKIGKIEAKKKLAYTIVSEDKKYVKLRDMRLDGNEQVFDVVNDSDIESAIGSQQHEDIVLMARLVKYGGEWRNCGDIYAVSKKCFDESSSKTNVYSDFEGSLILEQSQMFKDYFGTSDKRYIKSTKELKDILRDLDNTGKPIKDIINQLKAPFLILKTANGNYQSICDDIECLKDKDNPFYDKEKAQKETIGFLVDDEGISYEIACELLRRGMLDDAMIDQYGGKEEQQLINKNAQFLIDYFYNNCNISK